MKIGVEARDALLVALGVHHDVGAEVVEQLARDLLGGVRPDVDDLVVALTVGDQTFLVLRSTSVRPVLVGASSRKRSLSGGICMSSRQIEMPARVAAW